MTYQRHGFSVGMDRVEETFFLTIKAQGKLTHQDYQVIIPMLESSLLQVKDPKINVLVDGSELEGWEPRAAWDDLKLGLKHGSEFAKIAIYGHKKWQQMSATIGTWFIAGDIKYFEDINEAIAWLRQD